MRAAISICLCLIALALAGCGKAVSGQIIGTWQMQEKPQTWEFKKDGTLAMDGIINQIYIRQDGAYKLEGSNLTLNLSGKVKATSTDTKEAISVNTINSEPAHPKQEAWEVDWQSPDQFTITSSTTVPAVIKTFKRSIG